jgi:hypothetical protein
MLGVIFVFGSVGFALLVALFAARRGTPALEKMMKVSSRFSLVLILEAIPVALGGWIITWLALSQAERAARCDVCPSDEWLYIGFGLFGLGGVLQLVPIALGVCQRTILGYKRRKERAKGIPISAERPQL